MRPKTTVRQDATHRLIPSKHDDRSVLQRLADNDEELQDLFDLDGATNDRLLGESNLLPGISVHELLFESGVPTLSMRHFVMHTFGSRFNGPDRGAWYATDLATARAEIAFHKRQELQEIGWRTAEIFVLDDYLADFRPISTIFAVTPLSRRVSELRRVTDARATTTGRRLGRDRTERARAQGTCLVCSGRRS